MKITCEAQGGCWNDAEIYVLYYSIFNSVSDNFLKPMAICESCWHESTIVFRNSCNQITKEEYLVAKVHKE